MTKKLAQLSYSSSITSADVLYLGKFFCPDNFISLQVGKKRIALLNKLEFTRGVKESQFTDVLPLEEWIQEAKKAFPKVKSTPAQVICLLAKKYKITSFEVHTSFPTGLAFELQKAKIKLEVAPAALFPERYVKKPDEINAIKKALKITAGAIQIAEEFLQAAQIKKGYLYLDGEKLTVEDIRFAMDTYSMANGATAQHTIVACGKQACDPHCIGSGPIKANSFIIIDHFPQVAKTGFYGDMTRTFFKGTPSDAQGDLYNAVLNAQKAALSQIKANVEGKQVHEAAASYFEKNGYKTEKIGDVNQGFIHGLGHGLGLDLHEDLRISPQGDVLKKGNVFTVEPGLYYPKIGGVRIEDVVEVTTTGYKKLSNYHYNWIIN